MIFHSWRKVPGTKYKVLGILHLAPNIWYIYESCLCSPGIWSVWRCHRCRCPSVKEGESTVCPPRPSNEPTILDYWGNSQCHYNLIFEVINCEYYLPICHQYLIIEAINCQYYLPICHQYLRQQTATTVPFPIITWGNEVDNNTSHRPSLHLILRQ